MYAVKANNLVQDPQNKGGTPLRRKSEPNAVNYLH